MARPAKPFQYRGNWVSKVNGKLTTLGTVGPNDGKNAPASILLALAQRRAEAEAGVLTQECLVADLVAQYLTRPVGSDRTKKKNRSQLSKFLDLFKGRKVQTLRVTDADSWSRAVADLAPATYNSCLKTVRAVVNFAIARDLYKGKNPFLTLKTQTEAGRTRVITDDEFSALLEVASQDEKELLTALRFTVSRPQDWEASWSSWEANVLTIKDHKTAYAIGAKEVNLGQTVQAMLAERRERRGSDGPIFPDAHLAFRWFGRLKVKAGLQGAEDHASGEDLTPYNLRHTCVTDLARSNVAIQDLMKLGSWQTPTMALRYMHAANRSTLSALLK